MHRVTGLMGGLHQRAKSEQSRARTAPCNEAGIGSPTRVIGTGEKYWMERARGGKSVNEMTMDLDQQLGTMDRSKSSWQRRYCPEGAQRLRLGISPIVESICVNKFCQRLRLKYLRRIECGCFYFPLFVFRSCFVLLFVRNLSAFIPGPTRQKADHSVVPPYLVDQIPFHDAQKCGR